MRTADVDGDFAVQFDVVSVHVTRTVFVVLAVVTERLIDSGHAALLGGRVIDDELNQSPNGDFGREVVGALHGFDFHHAKRLDGCVVTGL